MICLIIINIKNNFGPRNTVLPYWYYGIVPKNILFNLESCQNSPKLAFWWRIRKFFYLIPNPTLELIPSHPTSQFEKKCDCKSRKLQEKNATGSVLNLRFGHYESMSLRFFCIPRFITGFSYLESKHNFTLKIPYFHLK